MPDKKEDTKTTILESAAKGGMSAAMPYIFLGGAAYLGYRYLSEKTNPSTIAGGVNEYVKEIVKTTTETVKETATNNVITDTIFGSADAKNKLSSGTDIVVNADNPAMKANITGGFVPDEYRQLQKDAVPLSQKVKEYLNLGGGTTKSEMAQLITGGKLHANGVVTGGNSKVIGRSSVQLTTGYFSGVVPNTLSVQGNIASGAKVVSDNANANKAKMATFSYGSESPLAQSKKDKSTTNEIGQVSNNANTNTSKVKVTRNKDTGRYSVSVPKGKKIKVVRRFS
jgi:hypothetical protein